MNSGKGALFWAILFTANTTYQALHSDWYWAVTSAAIAAVDIWIVWKKLP